MLIPDITKAIGNTPLVHIRHLAGKDRFLYAKVEGMNPLSSAKDRVALVMIEEAEKKGLLHSSSVIVEPTSGNTGIGLAFVAAVKGYHCILVMPETMSIERRKLVKALGAELILTPGEKGMQGAIDKAKQLAVQDAKYFIPSQFDNPDNPLAHYRTTGPEIYRDMDGKIDFFIATVGTGGTLCGSARYLKEQAPHVQVIAVEPSASAVLEGGKPGPHGIQGIGAGFIPGNYDASLVDKVIGVDDEAAMAYARRAAKEEGLLVGISSGAALAAAVEVSNAHPRSRIAVILPDSGERYLSTALFS